MVPVTLEVHGMTCTGCERHVTEALAGVGVQDVDVDWRGGQARFGFPEEIAEHEVRAAVAEAGYEPGVLRGVQTAADTPAAAGAPPVQGGVDFDLVVVGAGSAAFAAAITARQGGHSVALVEAGTVGGTCVNVGCVPSKALLAAGELRGKVEASPFAGLELSAGGVDLAALVAQKDQLVDGLRQAKYLELVDDYGFEIIAGHGRFVGPDTLEVDGRQVTARAFVVATGASPWVPPIDGLEQAGYLTSRSALELEEVPDRLAVIGANAVGLELGQLFAHLGAEVTFLEAAGRVAPFEEPEVSAAITDALAAEGAVVHTGATTTKVERDGDLRVLHVDAGGRSHTVEVDEILVATGRRPTTGRLGLADAGVQIDGHGGIVTDEGLRTANPRIWAAGDVVADTPQYVYVSAYHGAVAADNALAGAGRSVDYRGLPRVMFTTPQIAGAGLTAARARRAGIEVETSLLELEHVPRALVNRDTTGLVKLVAEAATGRLVGASVVAETAGDVIQAAVLAIRHGLTVEELAATFHPYLTMAEGLKLAAQTFDRDVSRLSCCAA